MAGKPSESAERRLRLSEELTQRILDVAPCGIVHVDSAGRILNANPEAERVLGLTTREVTGRDIASFGPITVHTDGSPCPPEHYPMVRALRTGERDGPTTIGVRRPDGGVSWAVFGAAAVRDPETEEVTGAVATFLDVTDRREAHVRAIESEARLRSVFQSVPSTILVVDLEGIIRDVNRTKPHYGSREQVIGRPMYEFVHPDDAPVVRACFEGVIASSEPDGYTLAARPEIPYSYEVRMGPLLLDGVIAGATVVARDVTMRDELQARLMTSDRMASVGTLAAGVAHEINNPLTFMLVHMQGLAEELRTLGQPQMETRLRHVTEGAQRIRRVVRDLSNFSRPDDEEILAIDVHEVLDATLRMADNELRHRAVVRRDYGPVPRVPASRSRLGQVFLNLVVNAVQALPEGDVTGNEIRVRTRADRRGRAIIEVTDSGAGIDPDMIGRVFEPFVTTKGVGEGTGLGLYICHNIVTSLGGTLDIESTPGIGSTFRVTLPRASAETPLAPPRTASPLPDVSPRRVLVVDDEARILDVLSAGLAPHKVDRACDGRQAIEALREASYDMVLCDLVMPEKTGMDVYEFLAAHRPGEEQRIVFMSGGAFTPAARAFLEKVANPCLEKPFGLGEVHALIAATPDQ